jgi:purine-binding chemotaxis protein CheW
MSQFLSFTLAGSVCAVPLLEVREILQLGAITPMPSTPPSIRGVIDVRGDVVPVVDLARKLGLGETALTRAACTLLVEVALEGGPITMGVLADTVREVIEASPDEILAPPAFGPGVRVDCVTGLARAGDGLVLLLDLGRVISVQEAQAAADAIAAASDVLKAAQDFDPLANAEVT